MRNFEQSREQVAGLSAIDGGSRTAARVCPTRQRPLRILHVVGRMQRGGVETWLMHVLRGIDRERFQMDFLVETTEPGAYDADARALGSNVIPCLDSHNPWRYRRHFAQVLREHGPYEVIHSHEHFFSGHLLRLAHAANVPIRIAHSHNDTSGQEAQAGLPRKAYVSLMKRWIARYATGGIAVSRNAAVDLFGTDWQRRPQHWLLPCGIDLTPFTSPIDQRAIRAEFGVPADAFVIGHVGRFVEQKNHSFLIDIFAAVAKRQPNARLLLVGEGPLRPEIEARVARAGLTAQVIFAGGRNDVPRLMRGTMDLFLLPSLYEGLPVVGIEAQAAALPFILSDTITREVVRFPDRTRFLSLASPPAVWADHLLALRAEALTHPSQNNAVAMQGSPFDARSSREVLERIYVAQRS